MGSTQAQDLADIVRGGFDLRAALHYHLRANHFPPLPLGYIDVAVQVIEAFGAEESEVDILLPPKINPTPSEAWEDDEGQVWCDIDTLARILHLWPFIESQFETEDEED